LTSGPLVEQAILCHANLGEDEKAIACADEMLEIGRDVPRVYGYASLQKAMLLKRLNKDAEALLHARNAERAGLTRFHVELETCLFSCLLALGNNARDEGRCADAVALMRECEKYVNGNAEYHSAVMNVLCYCYTDLGDVKRAFECRKKDVEVVEAGLGREHVRYAYSVGQMGQHLLYLKRFAAAETMFEESLRVRRLLLGDDDALTRETLLHWELARISLRYRVSASKPYAPPNPVGQCESCENVGEGLGCCTSCKRVWYCNAECQMSHWAAHKAHCREWKTFAVKFAVPFGCGRSPEEMRKVSAKHLWREYQQYKGVVERLVIDMPEESLGFCVFGERAKVEGETELKAGRPAVAEDQFSTPPAMWEQYVAGKAVGTPFVFVECTLRAADCCMQRRTWNTAIGHYVKVLQLWPDDVAARRNCAMAFEELGRFRQALLHFRVHYDVSGGTAESAELIRPIHRKTEEEEAKCGNCGKPGVLACSKCCHVRYCSAACQKQHWRVHRGECAAAEQDGSWFRGLDEAAVFRKLLDSYRLRRSEVLKHKEETICPFEDYLKRAVDKCVLPRWWDEARTRQCLEQTRKTLSVPLVKEQVVATALYAVRSLAATVCGTSYCSPERGAEF
jgi:tetratricopeptide (TPR) repeat protein